MLRLRVRFRSCELSREFSSFDDLTKAKNELKNVLRMRYSKDEKVWIVDDYIEKIDSVANVLVHIFRIDRNTARKIVEAHNDVVKREFLDLVKGSYNLVILPSWLNDDVYGSLVKYATKVRGRIYRVDIKKVAERLITAKDKDEVRKVLVEWARKLMENGVVCDIETIGTEVVDKVWEEITSRRVVTAEWVEIDGIPWIVLRFSDKKLYRLVADDLFKDREIPYNRVEFRAGEKVLNQITILSVKRYREEENAVLVAPFKFVDVLKELEKHGFRVDLLFDMPTTEKVLDVVDIEDKLRDYQREALQRWLGAGGRGCIQMPTGSGKTWVALGAIAKLRVPTVIIVPTSTLVTQWIDFLTKVLKIPKHMIGVLGGGRKEIGKPILVAIYNSASNHASDLARYYAFYIYDEGHHVAAETFKRIAWASLAPFRMVLSATVERDDKNEEMIYRLCGNLVYRIDYDELVQRGFVAPVNIEIFIVDFPPEERRQYDAMDNELRDIKTRMGEVIDRVAPTLPPDVDPYRYLVKNSPEFRELHSKAMSLVARMRVLEQRNSNKIPLALLLARRLLSEGSRTFIFTNLEDQARTIYEELRKEFGGRVALVTGSTPNSERDMLFNLFRRGDIRCIVTTTVLDEGVDAPSADSAIIVSSRALSHPRQFVQRIGRVVRPSLGKVAKIYILRTRARYERKSLLNLVDALREVYNVEPKIREVLYLDPNGGYVKFRRARYV